MNAPTTLSADWDELDLDHVRRLIGKGGDKVLPELTELSADSDEGKKIAKRRADPKCAFRLFRSWVAMAMRSRLPATGSAGSAPERRGTATPPRP